MENRVNFSISPIGNSVDFYFKSHKKSIYSISNTLLIVEDCKYTCPGLGCAGYVVGCAGYVVGGLRRLCGGSWYILYPLRGATCKSCKISSKAEILKLDPSVAIIILG